MKTIWGGLSVFWGSMKTPTRIILISGFFVTLITISLALIYTGQLDFILKLTGKE